MSKMLGPFNSIRNGYWRLVWAYPILLTEVLGKALGPSDAICIISQGKCWAYLIASAPGVCGMSGSTQYY